MIATARTIQRHLPNVVTFFAHRLTNAVTEGLNSKIQTIKKMAYCFRNREHFKTAIYFHCGGLDLYPDTHGEPGRTTFSKCPRSDSIGWRSRW